MKAGVYRWFASVLAVLLTTLAVLVLAGEAPETAAESWGTGLELLTNGDFEGSTKREVPSGWFKAMLPDKTLDLRAGVEEIPGRGKVAFIEQAGVKVRLCNNWAQRLDTVPLGAAVRLTAEVKTENVPADTGFMVVQCWDQAGKLIAGATSQSVEPIGGTQDWKRLSLELTVPTAAHAVILRCGLAESGKIWFDNVSLTVVSPPAPAGADEAGSKGEGFEVTEGSLRQLETVAALGDDLMAYAQQKLGADVGVRREIFAQGRGRFQIVLHLDLSESH